MATTRRTSSTTSPHITDFGFVRDGDSAVISAPIDVLGINYYKPTLVAAATPELAARAGGGHYDLNAPFLHPGTDLAYELPQEGPYTAMDWRIEPGSLCELLLRLHRDYPGMPMMITENGAAFADEVAADGAVHDPDRIDYVRGHLSAVHDAISGGADVRGYFLWSLMDNFEWAFGYSRRFGMVHVDYGTQQRTIKDSGHWYRELIARNGLDRGQ